MSGGSGELHRRPQCRKRRSRAWRDQGWITPRRSNRGGPPAHLLQPGGSDWGERASGGLLRLEPVADPAHGHDVLGIRGLELDLLAKALDVGVERAAVAALAVTPDP